MRNKQDNSSELICISSESWDKLGQKKIFFGHQSVGSNIIAGITDVMSNNAKIKLLISNTSAPGEFANPIFAHAAIGKNNAPLSKIDHFNKIIHSGVGKNVDIACFKFCYIDINRNTDINKLFISYARSMDELVNEYANVKFLYCTVPLKLNSFGIKAQIKRILGVRDYEKEDNSKRNEFNQLILKKYSSSGRVFDIARFESIDGSGNVYSFIYKRREYLYMNPKYTDDGGHLNVLGRRKIAEKLLLFLVSLK